MEKLQADRERAVGNAFITWYNLRNGTRFQFQDRAGEAPDLIYRDDRATLQLEITVAYYNSEQIRFEWDNMRERENAPDSVSGINWDEALIESINQAIQKKCRNAYGRNTLLIVNVIPRLTTRADINDRLGQIVIPEPNPFEGIFLCGGFGESSSGEVPGFEVWKLA